MKRVIFSLYIDIPEDELDYQPPFHNDTIPKTIRTKERMKEYYEWLKFMQQKYAESLGIENASGLKKQDIYFSVLKKFAEKNEEIIAVPVSNINFFDHWDVTNNGVAILRNVRPVDTMCNQLAASKEKYERNGKTFSVRSPTAKYWNARALLIDQNMSGTNDVYNTGIVGISSNDLEKLNYWEDFSSILKLMTELKCDDGMWPEHLRSMFGWDNETIWSFRMNTNNVSKQWLDEKWHHFMDKWNYIPESTNLVHVINKEFGYVKQWYEKNHI